MNITKYKTIISASLLGLLLAFVAFGQMQNETRTLSSGQTLGREMTGAETHRYKFDLKTNEFFQVRIEQKGVVVALKLIDANGKTLATMDSPNSKEGPETLSFVAATAGNYTLEVSGFDAKADKGNYSIRREATRTATAQDRRRVEIERVFVEGMIAKNIKGQEETAIIKFEEAMLGWKELKDDYLTNLTIFTIYGVYLRLEDKQKAIDFFEHILVIDRKLKDYLSESITLSYLGYICLSSYQYEKAGNYYEQLLILSRKIKNRPEEWLTLNTLGDVYKSLAQYEKAKDYYEQALVIDREIKDQWSEVSALNNLGDVYESLAQYEKAKDYYEKSLVISRKIRDQRGEVSTLNNLGDIYKNLGQFDNARNYYEQSLIVSRENKDQRGEVSTLNNLGDVYKSLAQYEKAKDYYEKSLVISRKIKDQRGEISTLNNLGDIYRSLAQYEKGRDYHEQALEVSQETKDRLGEASTLNNLGDIYKSSGQYEKARDYYEQALLIQRKIKDPKGEGKTCWNLMLLWEELNNPKLAIIYGKQAVNAFQEIRGNIKGLDKESQRSFLTNNIFIYRRLSDILISAGRFPEAQTVLDLIKDEEYKQLSTLRSGETADTIPYSQAEADVIAKIENLVALERQRTELQKLLSTNGELSAEQNNKLAKLNLDIAAANKAFDVALDALGKAEASATTRVDEIKGGKVLQSALTELSEKTNSGVVALYTVLGTEEEKDASGKPIKDKQTSKFGWVIMVTENRYTAYPIDVENLEETVFQFRAALSSDKYNPQPLAEKIYNAIFRQTSPKLKKTLEQDLQDYLKPYKDKTLMWSLDGVLRYIPMAALHDGKQYLVENYRNTVFTKESFVWLMNEYHADWKALGLGVSDKREGFSELPGVKTELETIIREPNSQTGILNGSIKLNDNFKKQTFFNIINAGGFPVVHISSHYSFDSGKPENSFLLAGDGNLTFAEIKQQQNLFKKVDLLTLSACDTGVAGNGKEAEGFAYLAQSLGAKSVIASLWKVSDAGTPELMTRFYQLRKDNSQMSKGEAFRLAQLSLLDTEAKTKETSANRSKLIDLKREKIELPLFVKDKQKPFAHPHYWASFVLIGNWR